MAITGLAMAAVTAFATAVASQLGGDVVAGFKNLLHRRFAGDRRAESALAAVEANPSDAGARQALVHALEYYAATYPDFMRELDVAVNYVQYYVDQSHSSNWTVRGDIYGTINAPVDDNRVYQSGQYVAGRDVWVDQSSVNVDLDQMSALRNATGFPRFVMVVGILVALAGFAVVLTGFYWFATTGVSGGLDSSDGSFPPVLTSIVQRIAIGFGVFFAGAVLLTIGNIFRPKNR
jgi:hypothetical protein